MNSLMTMDVTLLLILSAAAASDVCCGRIGNGLILTGLLCGVTGSIAGKGPPGLVASLAGMLLPVFLPGVLYLFRMIGAGDIKLLMVVGSFKGPVFTFNILFCSFLIGGILSCVLLIRRGTVRSRFHYLAQYLLAIGSSRYPRPYMAGVNRDGRIYFSIPILLSVWIAFERAGRAGGVY